MRKLVFLPFCQPWVSAGALPVEGAETSVAWNDRGLCFYVKLHDADILTTATGDNERLWELGDTVEFFIKRGEDQPSYWEIHVSPNDCMMDIFIHERGKYLDAGETGWKEAVKYESGTERTVLVSHAKNLWEVVLNVSWKAFGAATAPLTEPPWQFAVCRYNYRCGEEEPEYSSTAFLTEPSFHNYEDYHDLKFVSGGREHA